MQIPISCLPQKPTDLDLHCLQRQDISAFSKTRDKHHSADDAPGFKRLPLEMIQHRGHDAFISVAVGDYLAALRYRYRDCNSTHALVFGDTFSTDSQVKVKGQIYMFTTRKFTSNPWNII